MSEERPIDRLLALMARLRDPDRGCPWDVAQDFATIAPYTIEEAYEVADAIERRDMAGLKDELGDLLFQVVFHGRMAEEAGHFDFDDIATAITDKMIRRHPHVFGDAAARTAGEQPSAWETMKAAERAAKHGDSTRAPSALDGVAAGLPALTRAAKIQSRASRVGFDWTEAALVLDKIEEEIGEVRAELLSGAPQDRLEDEVGDLMFALTNLARKLALDPEATLRRATAKFERRFRAMETILGRTGESIEQQQMPRLNALWDQVKAEEG
jgi:ATP diphosphatase